MVLGLGLVLVAVGALLTFGVHLYTDAGHIQLIGVLLMVIGTVALAIDVKVITPRRRAANRTTEDARGARRGATV